MIFIIKIMQVSIFLLLFIDLVFGIIYIYLVPSIATIYLKNSLTFPTLYGMVLLLPLISMTSLLKGYFIGIGKVEKTNICQISEEISRLVFIIIFVDLFIFFTRIVLQINRAWNIFLVSLFTVIFNFNGVGCTVMQAKSAVHTTTLASHTLEEVKFASTKF